ncbi:MAG: acetolactate decarboxylase [Anaerolineales bacterium]|nr:acetolactate decarboxylase [Anaerolineales bacterium]
MTTPKNYPLYLCSPVNALVEGIYEENIPIRKIKEHGDFGLGTFDNLDGEMVMLDGRVFQITAAGHVIEVDDQVETPFACVTFYQPASHDELTQEQDYSAFLEWLDGLLPSPNIFYAIRIEGEYACVRTRSVPKQESYKPLVEVAREQPVFEFENLRGTLAGFYTPAFMSSLNVPGLHLHFLSDDLQHGGHLLECRPGSIRAGIQFISRLELSLPMSLDYLTWDFQRDIEDDLDQAEK